MRNVSVLKYYVNRVQEAKVEKFCGQKEAKERKEKDSGKKERKYGIDTCTAQPDRLTSGNIRRKGR